MRLSLRQLKEERKRQRLEKLEKRLSSKLVLAQKLELENRNLRLLESILSFACEYLVWVGALQSVDNAAGACAAAPCRAHIGCSTQQGSACTPGSSNHATSLSKQQQQQQGQLQQEFHEAHATVPMNLLHDFLNQPAAPFTVEPVMAAVAPTEDPMQLLRSLLSRAPLSATTSARVSPAINLTAMQADYASMVRELGLCLVKYNALVSTAHCDNGAASAAAAQQQLQQMRDLLCQHWHTCATVGLWGRAPEEVLALMLSDTHSGDLLQEPQIEQYLWLVRSLDLTAQQKQQLAAAAAMLNKQVANAQSTRQQLLAADTLGQQQQQQQLGADTWGQQQQGKQMGADVWGQLQQQQQQQTSSSSSSTGSCWQPCCTLLAEGSHELGLFGRIAMVSELQQCLQKVQVSMHKEFFMHAAVASFVWGSMLWPQVAKAHILMAPLIPHPCIILKIVADEVSHQASHSLSD